MAKKILKSNQFEDHNLSNSWKCYSKIAFRQSIEIIYTHICQGWTKKKAETQGRYYYSLQKPWGKGKSGSSRYLHETISPSAITSLNPLSLSLVKAVSADKHLKWPKSS